MSDLPLRARARVTGWGVYAALFLSVSAVVHIGTYVGLRLRPHARFSSVSISAFPQCLSCLFCGRATGNESVAALGLRYRQLDWREWRPFLPAWAPPALAILGAYAIANFFFAAVHLPVRATGAMLTDAQAMYLVCMFSGRWLMFYALPLLFFTYDPGNTTPANAPPAAAA
jgi:hypothetical protein